VKIKRSVKEVQEDVVDFWFDTIYKEFPTIGDKQFYYDLFSSGALKFFSVNLTGIFGYMIHEWRGQKIMSEMIFYILPAYRGKLSLVKRYITRAEKVAIKNGCKQILIGGNIGFKDDIFLKLLNRWGYVGHTVVKEL
jgi:hypothetical protein